MSNLTLGLNSALRYADAYNKGRRPRWRPPAGEEIRQLRQDVGLTQEQFANRYGFSLVSLRKWEQGRATPEQVTVMLLRMIKADPEGVLDIVDRARQREHEDA